MKESLMHALTLAMTLYLSLHPQLLNMPNLAGPSMLSLIDKVLYFGIQYLLIAVDHELEPSLIFIEIRGQNTIMQFVLYLVIRMR